MISRRLIRIKVLQAIYAYKKNGATDFVNHYKEFEFSIRKSYNLYLSFLLLMLELKHYSYVRIDQIKNRVIKDEKQWKRLVRFANNRVFVQLESNAELKSLVLNEKLSWSTQPHVVKELFNTIVASDLYDTFLLSEDTYEADNKFVRKIIQDVVLQSESLFSYLEEHSIFWNDEVDYIISMVEKTIKQFQEKNRNGGVILPLYKDAEVEMFAKNLFSQTINKWNEYNGYIDSKLKNWDQDRVAELDVILLQMAVSEAIFFTEIPVRATLNEYIELAKWYSTEKSSIFVNGILHSVFDTLQEQKIIVKKGRGLLQ